MPGRLHSFFRTLVGSSTLLGAATALTVVAAAGAVLTLPGCSELACPTHGGAAFEVMISNGAYEDECLYAIGYDAPSGTRHLAECTPSGTECICLVGDEPGPYVLRLLEAGNDMELGSQGLTAHEGSCGVVTEPLFWIREPAESLALPSCVAAHEKLRACELGDPPTRECIEQGIRIAAPFFDDEARAVNDCWFECISTPSCEDLERSMCAPQSAVTDHERCLGACLEMDEETIREYAPLVAGDYCPAGAGGAGGGGG